MIDLLAKIAPNIAKGMAGGLGGAVKSVLRSSGIDIDRDSEENQALYELVAKADPDTLERIKQADATFKTRMAELDIDLKRIEADDRRDARAMYRKTKDRLVPILAVIILVFSFTLVGSLFFLDFPPTNRDLINIFFGLIVGYAGNVVTFYFGSSDPNNKK